MKTYARSALTPLVALALAAAAHAQATDVVLFRTNINSQTSATTADYLGTFLAAGIDVTDAGNYGAGTLTLPDGTTSYSFTQTGTAYDYGSPLYASAADLEADFPHGDYTFSFDAGNDPADALTLTDAQDRFSPDVPLAQEYATLKSAVAGQAVTVHVAGFTPGTGTSDEISFYILRDNTAGFNLIDDRNSNTNAYSFDIQAGALQANHSYTLNLYYSSRIDVLNAGLGGATAFLGYDQLTTLDFHRRRRSRARILRRGRPRGAGVRPAPPPLSGRLGSNREVPDWTQPPLSDAPADLGPILAGAALLAVDIDRPARTATLRFRLPPDAGTPEATFVVGRPPTSSPSPNLPPAVTLPEGDPLALVGEWARQGLIATLDPADLPAGLFVEQARLHADEGSATLTVEGHGDDPDALVWWEVRASGGTVEAR